MPNNQLTGAQIATQNDVIRKGIHNAIEVMKIRQWAVEQAVKVANLAENTGNHVNVPAMGVLVKVFYDFVTKQG